MIDGDSMMTQLSLALFEPPAPQGQPEPTQENRFMGLIMEHFGDTGNRIAGVFEQMAVAEEEITAAKLRYPEHVEVVHDSFRYLVSSAIVNQLYSDKLYRGHCREIIDRVVKGEDVTLATDAELLVLYAEASLRAPLNGMGALLYFEAFLAVFGPDEVPVPANDMAFLRKEYGTFAADEKDRQRRKFAAGNRDVRRKEQGR